MNIFKSIQNLFKIKNKNLSKKTIKLLKNITMTQKIKLLFNLKIIKIYNSKKIR